VEKSKAYRACNIVALALTLFLTACAGDLTLAPSPAPSAGIPPSDALLADNFLRADTSPGILSSAPTGQAYTLYVPSDGAALNLISTVGQIAGDAFVAPEGQTVYATVITSQPIARIGMRFEFASGPGSDVANSVAMAISKDDLYVANMAVHFYVSVDGWNLQTRNNAGAFVAVCGGTFSPPLKTDGTKYDAEVRVISSSAIVSIAGYSETCSDPNAAAAIGPYIFWENAYLRSTTTTVSAISATWAGFAN